MTVAIFAVVQSDGMMNIKGIDNTGSKLLLAQECLQQQTTTTMAPGTRNTAIAMAIQQNPKWL
jgi:hypothetical protein